MANWADLDHDVLTEIAWRIKLHEDFVVFREVVVLNFRTRTLSCAFLDVISYQKQIYAINSFGMIMVCDIKGDNPTVVHQVTQLPWELYYRIKYEDLDGSRKGLMHAYLVESDGALWVITRLNKDDEDDLFQVFEVDLSTNNWEEIYDLGDKALFLGYNSSLCIEVSDKSYCKPNSIYFTYDCPDVTWNGSQKNDMGVYNFKMVALASSLSIEIQGMIYQGIKLHLCGSNKVIIYK
ncbi:hypothetical protein EZV62_021288 [Acer yangbiense]|uniref:KIB1-4 beta-propeller domain-containing protein n=1 Tax=Acer yangbiense TaxID=1000413 RepID=A0A5C7H5X3_9ROSI|nr:hypothetical protein EZV62_021288 [Acer yangbiense]